MCAAVMDSVLEEAGLSSGGIVGSISVGGIDLYSA